MSQSIHEKYDVIILGAGASGLMCGLTAIQRGFSCALIDASPIAGRKLRIAGGGKGNITNLEVSPKFYIGENQKFCQKILVQCPPQDILQRLQDYKIPWEIRTHNQVFCKVQAVVLVKKLMEDCQKKGIQFLLKHQIKHIYKTKLTFVVETSKETLKASNVVIALGSQAWPSAGGSNLGLQLAQQWKHKIIPILPVLVPFILPQHHELQGLAGISIDVQIQVEGAKHPMIDYPLLFTHKGLSGPAILQASCFWKKGQTIIINFLPKISLIECMHMLEHHKLTVKGLLKTYLPTRLINRLIPYEIQVRKIAGLSKKERLQLATRLHTYPVIPSRTEGIQKAEVIAGGVDTRELHPHTLESRIQPGLYFSGEVIDITGLLGGYNLHWAWASGKAVGRALHRKILLNKQTSE